MYALISIHATYMMGGNHVMSYMITLLIIIINQTRLIGVQLIRLTRDEYEISFT